MGAIKQFLLKYYAPVLGGVIGLVVAILLLTIGFFPTLLIVALVAIGAVLGGMPKVRAYIKAGTIGFFKSIFKGKQD